jgi:uncharacterized protein
MAFMIAKVLIGLVVGTLIGMTGLGGGVLLLPLLIFGLGVPPIVAVGTDAVFNCVTKLGASYLHWRQGTVRWPIVMSLASGSIPGAIAGVSLLAHLRAHYGAGVNDILRTCIGVLLLFIPVLVLVQGRIKRNVVVEGEALSTRSYVATVVIGVIGGFLVGMTSVGSGSIMMLLLLLVYAYSPVQLVGTDIVHALFLTAATGLMHLGLKTVDLPLLGALLVGSIPGGLLGTRLSMHVPSQWLRRILCSVIFLTGARMLGA